MRRILERGQGHREYAVGLELDQGEVYHVHAERPKSPLKGFPCVAVVQVVERPVPGDEALARARQEFDERLNQHPWWGADHLIVILLASDARAISARSYVFDRTGSPTEASTAFVLSRPNQLPRRDGLPRCLSLRERRVGVVGLGTCGSLTAVELAKAGIGNFVLIDHRRLDLTTVPQHLCGISDLGRSATKAVRDRLFDTNPHLTCETIEVDVSDDFDSLQSHLRSCDLLVSASGNGQLQRRVNALALAARTPAVLGLARPAFVGRAVLRVRPFFGPCLACLGKVDGENSRASNRVGRSRSGNLRPDRSEAHGEGGAFDAGPSIDASPMAAMVVQLALSELCRDTEQEATTWRDDTMHDHYVWAERHRRDLAGRSELKRGPRDRALLGWLATGAMRDPDCSLCAGSMRRKASGP